jgi:hypothetical protein
MPALAKLEAGTASQLIPGVRRTTPLRRRREWQPFVPLRGVQVATRVTCDCSPRCIRRAPGRPSR